MKTLGLLMRIAALSLPFTGELHAASLQLKPSLCAINEGEQVCAVSVSVSFVGDENGQYCLSVAGEGIVDCFAVADRRELKVRVSAESDTQFLVTRQDRGEPVASAVLKVARFRPARHQRRYGWGLL